MTGAAHVTTGTVRMGGVLAIISPTGHHKIGYMRRSDRGDAPCLGLLGEIVGATGDMVARLQAIGLVLHAGPRLLIGTSLLTDPGPRFWSDKRRKGQTGRKTSHFPSRPPLSPSGRKESPRRVESL